MSIEDRTRWDSVFRKSARNVFPAPDPFLLQFTPPPSNPEARALDLCAGVGQNGLWLAEQGYATDLIDISRVALQRARTEATSRNLRNVNIFQQDVDDLFLNTRYYEMVCVFRYLKRELFPMLRDSVTQGGRVIYETFNLRYLKVVEGFNPNFLLDVGELPRYFPDWQILHLDESDYRSRLVAVKL
jgi:tellurite methyltransferase